jgi:hypothetical protein
LKIQEDLIVERSKVKKAPEITEDKEKWTSREWRTLQQVQNLRSRRSNPELPSSQHSIQVDGKEVAEANHQDIFGDWLMKKK